MKKLILLPLFASFSVIAGPPEIVSPSDSKQIVSSIRDIEITEMLENTKEFKDCRKPYDANQKDADKAVQAAQTCLKGKLGDLKDPEKLQKLSDALNLQNFGLVKSKSAMEIQEYLNKKMYKSMTGVDLDETNKKKLMESLKFKNKKHIDQAIFIRMYKTQLSKNALFEISRYCFENLRVNQSQEKNFGDHWKNFEQYLAAGKQPNSSEKFFDPNKVNDTGEPAFELAASDPEKKDEIYDSISKSIKVGKDFPVESLNSFFNVCGQTIVKLCEKYTKDNSSSLDYDKAKSDDKTTGTSGAASCLTKSRLLELKKAMANAEKVEKQFNELQENDKTFLLSLTEGKPVIFSPGENGDPTLDDLTNYSSTEMLEGNKGEIDKKLKECELNATTQECASLVGNEEDFDKAKYKVEMEMNIKREVEMARIRALKDKEKQKLADYLKENGYFALLKEYEEGKLDADQIADKVGLEFEAKKVGLLEAMQKKVGSRQAKADATDAEKKKVTDNVIKETKSERARLAQVVLFNNVITSHLVLTRKGTDKTENLRNVNPWKNEEKALEQAKIDPQLFKNLKATDDGGSKNNLKGEEQLGGMNLIDTLLGKTSDDESGKPK